MIPTVALSLLLSWVQVSSNTYVVKSSAGEERAKRVLKELETFHQLIGTFVFESTKLPELPIEVVLAGDGQTLRELAPEYNGRKVAVDGYYQRGQDRDFIVLSGRVSSKALTTIAYHELTHYFLSRALMRPPTWLSEGMAEYFSAAAIHNDEVNVGTVLPEQMQFLRNNRLIPLREFFAVNSSSPYYNESLQANMFYSQSWAFVHFMMRGDYAPQFKRYLEALTSRSVDFLDFMGVNERTLENSFSNYLRLMIQHARGERTKIKGQPWTMKVEAIPDAEAHITIAEIFLAAGKLEDAQRHLETVDLAGQEFPRASYYQGILARIAGDNVSARELFVDALLDPQLGPRAAVQLVRMGELHIPAVRILLEQAAAGGTHTSDVHWALTEIYFDNMQRTEEAMRVARQRSVESPQPLPTLPAPVATEATVWRGYAQGTDQNFRYRLLSDSSAEPQVEMLVAPYYPADLLEQKLSGEVVMDVQVTERGEAAGIWLVSATPEIFSSLATAAVRQWRFEALSAKVRVVVEFTP